MKTGTWNHILIYSTCTYICDMYMHAHVHLPQRNLCFYFDKVGLPSTKHRDIKIISV